MRFARTYVLAFLFLAVTIPLSAQQTSNSTPQSSPQALTLLQQSLAVLTADQSITDVTLSGTVRRIAGADDESGTVVIKALGGTGSRIDLTLPSGPRSEIRNTSSVQIVGSWSGPDGVSYAVSHHNVLTDPAWSPAIAIASLLSAPNAIITYVGAEARNGQTVLHLTASQQFPNSPDPSNLLQRLSQTALLEASINPPQPRSLKTPEPI